MVFKSILIKYKLDVPSFHKILEISSVHKSQFTAQKNAQFQFLRFFGNFCEVVGWILVGYDKFKKVLGLV